MSHKETEEKIKKVMSGMQELKRSQGRKFDELSQHQLDKFLAIIKKLDTHFKSEGTIKKFCEWSIDEAPAALATWQETKSQALEYVSERTHQFIQQWEDDKREFKNAQDSLIQYCTVKYNVMAEEICKVEEQAFLDETEASVSQDLKQSSSRKSPTPTWLKKGLASVVIGSPLAFCKLGTIKEKMTHYKTKLESYNDNPCGYMSKRSHKCLKVIASQDHLITFITKQLEDSVQFLKQIKERIPQLRESCEQFYQQLLENKRSKTEIQEIYEPLMEHIRLLQRNLIIYSVSEVKKSDFTDGELKCNEKWESIIGEGSFSTVYKGVLSREGQPEIKVALKRYREPVATKNVWHFVDEERALR